MFHIVFFLVRKPSKAKTITEQVEMMTENIFGLIYGSYKYILKALLKPDGVVYNLRFPGYKWKFLSGGKYLNKNVKYI